MAVLVSLDPGLRMAGLAIFRDGKLTWAGLIKNPVEGRGAPAWLGMADAAFAAALGHAHHFSDDASEAAVELMQSYEAKAQKGDQNDLIELAGVAGAVVGLFGGKAVSYLPREWKGQVPKKQHQPRIWSKLTAGEIVAVDLGGYDLERVLDQSAPDAYPLRNTIDAIGIGLFHLGRLKGTGKPR